ncbi:unnamed protein product [Rhizophagus irregularis]|nr:unnamed protein product [Rhizophagus irregularis]
MYYILDGNREVPIVGTPDDYINIYTRCWQYNPDDRPDMHRVFSDLTKVNINEYTSLAEKNTNTSENFTEQKINNSLNDCSGLMYDQQSSYKIQIMNLTCSNYVSSQEDNEVSNGNDLKIIMTGTVDLKDLDINNNEHFKRINVKPSLENGNYEVFGSIISKDKKENLKSDFFITFGLYDINGFSAMIKTLNIENQKINITECYILWMIIGKPLELSVFSPKNRELQVYYMREYIILQPDKSHYTIRTSRQLSQEDMISVNIYYSTTNCGPMDIKFVGWSKNSISFQIIYNSTVISVDNDNDTDPLISIDIRISILSSKYKKLKIDNEEKEFYLNLIGYLLSNKNFIKESSGEDDPNNTHINKKMSFDNSIISINENYDETSELIMIDTEKNSNLEAIGVVINVAQTFDEFAPLIDNIDLKTKIKFALDICRGVAYLHECEILHRDIQSANVLVDGKHKVKMANFGLSRKFSDITRNILQNLENIRYMAPEKLAVENDNNNNNDAQKKKVPYDSKCEIYSVGALLWEIAELKKPHYDLDKSVLLVNIRKRVSERYCLPFSNDVPTEWRTIVTRAMEYDSMWRINISEICREL